MTGWESGRYREGVHPIERLRYVARARGADAESLVRETAGALRGLGLDTAGLVVACRRIVERHPTCGPLWWLCARMLTSSDPMAAARAAIEEMECDATDRPVDRRAARRGDGGDDRVARADRDGPRPARRRARARRRRRPPRVVVRAAARAGRDRERARADRVGGDRHGGRRPRARRGRGARRHDAARRHRLGRAGGRGRARLDAGVVRRRAGPPAARADARRRSSSASPTRRSTRGRATSRSCRWRSSATSSVPTAGRPAAAVRAECEMAPELLRTGIM